MTCITQDLLNNLMVHRLMVDNLWLKKGFLAMPYSRFCLGTPFKELLYINDNAWSNNVRHDVHKKAKLLDACICKVYNATLLMYVLPELNL